MTRYGILIAWAKQLARLDFASVLLQNLEEEKAADFQADLDRRVQHERKGDLTT